MTSNNIIYAKNVANTLKPGMLVRMATDEELAATNKIRTTGCWSKSSEAAICYKDINKTEHRTFILTENTISLIKNWTSINLNSLVSIKNYEHWNINAGELILVTEEVTTKKPIFQLLKLTRKENEIDIENVMFSKNEKIVQFLKEQNVEANKDDNVEFKMINFEVNVTETVIKQTE